MLNHDRNENVKASNDSLAKLIAVEQKLSHQPSGPTPEERSVIDSVFEAVFNELIFLKSEGAQEYVIDVVLDKNTSAYLTSQRGSTVTAILYRLAIPYNLEKMFNSGCNSDFNVFVSDSVYPCQIRLHMTFNEYSLKGLREHIKVLKEKERVLKERQQIDYMAEQINAISGWVDTIVKIRTTVEMIEIHATDIISTLKTITEKLSEFNPLKKKSTKPKI